MRGILFVLTTIFVTSSASLAAERTVTDDAGRQITIPDEPERIVVLHEALLGVPLADLGLVPVGSYGRGDDGQSLMAVDFYRDVLGVRAPSTTPRGIGPIGEIDLERLGALEPDLIIGTDRDGSKIERLSTIAPVYIQNASAGRVSGFQTQAELAELLGRQAIFEQRRDAYLERARELRATEGSTSGRRDYLGLFLTDQLNAIGDVTGVAQAMSDLGYSRLALAPTDGGSGMGSSLFVPLSTEIVGRLDPDILLAMNTYAGGRDEDAVRSSLDRIVPGWSRFLKPAIDGRILYLDSAKVVTPSIASAENTLDAYEDWLAGR
ncbi:ABC transporter substrate-binding protein [Notoacmeibacter ruber]|uniref:ABC transporter substrate-binding protein n=1 Tax=Notoacmeibacter ruber TaxID=2670375 RepID=UPI001FDF4F57|nr:ABC transporter substrate-binding protein [Notoacmeibacter ruber]